MLQRVLTIIFALLLMALPFSAQATRIKDIAQLQGVRSNQLVGYGLVVGLNGTGDSASTQFTTRSLVSMMERLGVNVDGNVKVDNVAAVIVTAELPPFAKAGSNIDVLVSSIGDADSLAGGTLLMTPLKAPDGSTYAVAQGSLIVGSLAFGGKAATVQKNHPTSARIPGGAMVEREVAFALDPGQDLIYQLTSPDFTTISRMSAAINNHFRAPLAQPQDSSSLRIQVPEQFRGQLVNFIAGLENLPVQPDAVARIVVNEKTGTIVMGEGVRIATVAVSHSNLNLVISERDQVSQPAPLSKGQTVVVPDTEIEMTEEAGNLVVMEMGVNIGDVAKALNAIGATPRDLIAIFQAIKAAGALHAELVIL
ncbi:flagellar basal body P-ring protein FlgI [Desulfuromonas sp. CSMB_57]|jgi:flagellar P-ring protein precursor FlgI|uniref:flagellar basal body P-ring protein FlgI n=1 Tax=Desulfuromonas sp. CSMB_57 TaxID=2807629 RepID=UPI001CD70A08|nr:flagellar basal body P-ring protein FlgI [Desulfuromonas sp. CSMB_57]